MTKPSLGHGCLIDVDKLVESRLLLQANSGGGKSWAIRRLLEQTYGRVQHIVLDSEGEFHTLREKFDYVLARRYSRSHEESRYRKSVCPRNRQRH